MPPGLQECMHARIQSLRVWKTFQDMKMTIIIVNNKLIIVIIINKCNNSNNSNNSNNNSSSPELLKRDRTSMLVKS